MIEILNKLIDPTDGNIFFDFSVSGDLNINHQISGNKEKQKIKTTYRKQKSDAGAKLPAISLIDMTNEESDASQLPIVNNPCDYEITDSPIKSFNTPANNKNCKIKKPKKSKNVETIELNENFDISPCDMVEDSKDAELSKRFYIKQ